MGYRDYQLKAVDASINHFQSDSKYGGLVVLPTGSGKSWVIAGIADRLKGPILVLQPSKEILEQNFKKFMLLGNLDAGIFSASVGKKELRRVTFATIGSIINVKHYFKHFQYVVVDECHFVNAAQGQYNDFLRSLPNAKLVGLTATPYRLATTSLGSELRFLTRTRPRIFGDVIAYEDVGTLLKRGYLAKVKYISYNSIDDTKIALNSSGSDFSERSLNSYMKSSNYWKSIMNVLQRIDKTNRKHILSFVSNIEQAQNIVDNSGLDIKLVTGKTKKRDREKILNQFKTGKIRHVINVGVLTTGFDFPELDCVVMSKPTMSLALYYQIIGRGIRPHESKTECWYVDMANNINRFGKVENFILALEKNETKKYCIWNGEKQLTNVIISDAHKTQKFIPKSLW